MRLLCFLFFLFIGLNSCNKNKADRKMRLVKMHNGQGSVPETSFTYNEQGLLSGVHHDYKGAPDAGSASEFRFENGKLSEIRNVQIGIAGLSEILKKFEYSDEGRLMTIKEEVIKGRPAVQFRYEFRYKDDGKWFDSCKIFITNLGVETPHEMYTFTRDGEGSILTQTNYSFDQNNWIVNYTEEFRYGNVDNPLYHLESPDSFRDYYSKKLAIKITRYDHRGTILDQKNFQAARLFPSKIIYSYENGGKVYYELN